MVNYEKLLNNRNYKIKSLKVTIRLLNKEVKELKSLNDFLVKETNSTIHKLKKATLALDVEKAKTHPEYLRIGAKNDKTKTS